MKCLILAAGYATRLYPLTENFPKPLLKVGDKAILDWLIDDLEQTGLIEEYVVVTNHKFAHIFEEWAEGRPSISVIDDGTSTNETRLGAVKDIELGIRTRDIDDDLLVMAGDNLLDFSLGGFLKYAQGKDTTCIMRYYEPNTERLHKCGVVEIDSDDRILSMEEKPAEPKSHWCCPPFYYYKKADLKLVGKGIAEGCGTDAPGSFIAWLCTQTTVHAWEMPAARFDIGSLDTYQEAQKKYGK
jgi:glucose-1-phosphate thymidylyltransferase